jgi:ankyrin repeat protein
MEDKVKKRIVVAALLAVLLAASAYAQTTDFFILVETGTPQDVQAAISKGADVNARVGTREETTPLIAAAAYNKDPEVISILLKAGADIDARDLHYGATALIWAANNNQNPEIIATLLKAGADIEAHNKDGETALIVAGWWNLNPEVITVLLNAGANAKVKNSEGKTAFDYAKNNWALEGTDALKQLEEASR